MSRISSIALACASIVSLAVVSALPSHADIIKQGAAYSRTVLETSSTDHITGATGLTLAIQVSKAGGAFASITRTVTELGGGRYAIALTSADTTSIGSLDLQITASGADPTDSHDQVVAFDPTDPAALGLSTISSTGTAVASLPSASAIATAVGGIVVDASSGSLTLKQALALTQAALTGKYSVGTLNTISHTQVTTYYKADGTTVLNTATVTYATNNTTVLSRTNVWTNLP